MTGDGKMPPDPAQAVPLLVVGGISVVVGLLGLLLQAGTLFTVLAAVLVLMGAAFVLHGVRLRRGPP